jgi:hypothetical protein
MTTPNENKKNMCPNPQLVEVERKEEKMENQKAEQSPNQRAIPETSQDKPQLDNKKLLSTTTGTATSSPKNRN